MVYRIKQKDNTELSCKPQNRRERVSEINSRESPPGSLKVAKTNSKGRLYQLDSKGKKCVRRSCIKVDYIKTRVELITTNSSTAAPDNYVETGLVFKVTF